jgi:hypothetical protein
MALGAGMQIAVTGAQASAAGPPASANPYSPAYHHSYRQGVIPTRPQLAKNARLGQRRRRRCWRL